MSIETIAARVQTFVRVESGATAIEYGLIAALVVIALIAALMHMNEMMTALYTIVETVSEVL